MNVAREKILASLEHAASLTLEDMLFTESAAVEAPFPADGDADYACALMDLPDLGALHLRVEQGLLDQLARDLLTPLGDVQAAARKDVLLEMLNVMAGHFMDRLRGGIFALTLPRPTDVADKVVHPLYRCLSAGDGRLFLGLEAASPNPEEG